MFEEIFIDNVVKGCDQNTFEPFYIKLENPVLKKISETKWESGYKSGFVHEFELSDNIGVVGVCKVFKYKLHERFNEDDIKTMKNFTAIDESRIVKYG